MFFIKFNNNNKNNNHTYNKNNTEGGEKCVKNALINASQYLLS